MSGLILGIDGGGTKSHLALFDPRGSCVTAAAYGPLNHEVMEGSFAQLEGELSGFIHASLNGAGARAADVAHACLGLAGVDTARQHEAISDMLRRAGLTEFTLCNDAYLGVFAGCPEGVGICAINGTGSTLAAVDRGGVSVQVGGIGDISDDRGGGGWYGSRALAAVYNEMFKCGPPTSMRAPLFEIVGASGKRDYVETITSKIDGGKLDYGALNRLVFKAAGDGDAVAAGILKMSAEHYAGGIAYLAGELDFGGGTLYVTLAGSVFVKEKVRLLPGLIGGLVREKLDGRPVSFVNLDVPPVAGAVLQAAKKAGASVTPAAVRAGLSAAGL
ncbi:MAG: hypothetical protein FWH06_04355 [Oscillospiraceae bacterium]|nr:hypothetical protein [Oscillospiraceae bacterium]